MKSSVLNSPAQQRSFRVNHAFRGVKIPGAGTYVVTYSYWPGHFSLSLTLAAIGLVGLIGWLFTTRRLELETSSAGG